MTASSSSSSSDQCILQEAIELEDTCTLRPAIDVEQQQLPPHEARGTFSGDSSHDWGSDRWNWPTNSKSDKYDPCPAGQVCCWRRRVGNYYVHHHCGDSTGPCCLTSPNSWFCCFCTVPLVVGIPSLALVFYLVGDESCNKELWPLILFPTLGVVTCLLLAWIRFSNPGILPVPDDISWKQQYRREDFQRLASDRRVPRKLGEATFVAGHGVYVEDFDHFCPWVGNVVGKANMIPFNSFSMIACVSLLVIIITSIHLSSQCSAGTGEPFG